MAEETEKKPAKKSKVWLVLVLAAAGLLAVPCIGCLAGIAIPAFTGYLTRVKTNEAGSNLIALFQGAAVYYEMEHVGPDGQVYSHCLVDAASMPGDPGPGKVVHSALGPSFDALGFSGAEPLYYRYEIVSAGGCGHSPGDMSLYSFRAHGDLDGDGVQSLYELASGSAENNQLMRAAGIYRVNELE